MKRKMLRALNRVCELHCPHHGRFCNGHTCCCRDRHWKGLGWKT